jgi:hypothetical protein
MISIRNTPDAYGSNSEALHDIFQPVFKEVDRLVGEQIKEVYIKRMKEHHPKGFEIKVSYLSSPSLGNTDPHHRQSSSLAASAQARTCVNRLERHTWMSKSFSLTMRKFSLLQTEAAPDSADI